MRILRNIFLFFLVSLTIFVQAAKKNTATIPNGTVNLAVTTNPTADRFANLGYGIRIVFVDDRANLNMVHMYDASTSKLPQITPNPTPKQFFPTALRQYMRTMGMNVDSDPATDYIMEVTLNEFHCDYMSGIGWSGIVMMNLKILDHAQKVVYPSVEIEGRAMQSGSPYSLENANIVLNQAIVTAFEDIDWDRVAFYLNKPQSTTASNNVSGENNAKKTVDLSKKLIYWSIDSRPAGADIYWRIVSASDEVKSQNSKYLGTTSYEATEAFNIKGLTEDNAADVQIIIKVEKEGYLPQTKKFNVSSALDATEIVAMFKLAKEEE